MSVDPFPNELVEAAEAATEAAIRAREELDEIAVSVHGFRYGELSPEQRPSPSERKPNAR